MSLDFGEGGVINGEVKTWDPPRLLSYTWVFPDGAESQVTFEVSADGDGTLLYLTHERVPAQDRQGIYPGLACFLIGSTLWSPAPRCRPGTSAGRSSPRATRVEETLSPG